MIHAYYALDPILDDRSTWEQAYEGSETERQSYQNGDRRKCFIMSESVSKVLGQKYAWSVKGEAGAAGAKTQGAGHTV